MLSGGLIMVSKPSDTANFDNAQSGIATEKKRARKTGPYA